MSLKLTNNGTSTLAASVTNVATSLAVQAGDAGLFPALSAGDWFPATLKDASGNMEIVRVTGRSGATLTIVRAQEGTAARAWNAGDRIDLRMTAAAMAAQETPDAVHGATAKTVLADADEIGFWDSVSTAWRKITWANFKVAALPSLGALIAGATHKATPIGADKMGLADSANSDGSVYATLTEMWTAMVAAMGPLVAALTHKATPLGADLIGISDSAAANAAKYSTLSEVMAIFSATAANIRANANSLLVSVSSLWSAAGEVTLTDATTIAVDMSTFINGKVTLAGNRTLGQPSNTKVGQTGRIRILQDATGSRTLAYHADWKWAGGTAPTLTTTASREDVLYYEVLAANRIFGSLNKDVR